MAVSQVSDQIRDLQTRINALTERLTSGIESHHHHAADPLNDQLAAVATRVEELVTGRERLSAVSARLSDVEHLLLVPDMGSSDPKVTQELLVLEEEIIREECVYYEEIKRMEALLSRNHLTAGVTDAANMAHLTAASEEEAAEARDIRQETDQLMQFNADLTKCINDMLAEWDKRIRRIEKK